jgi:hypothetical protein
VYLTLENAVGPGPLGEYILELMARGHIVTIKPTDQTVKQLERLRRQPEVEDGEKEQTQGQ